MMVSQHCLVFLTSIGHFYRLLSLHISFSIKHGYLVITCCSQCLIVHRVGVGWHECNRVETFHLFITKHARFSHILCHPVWKTHPVPAQMEIHVLHWGPQFFPQITSQGHHSIRYPQLHPAFSLFLFQLEQFHEHTNCCKVSSLENLLLIFLNDHCPLLFHFLSKTCQNSGLLAFALPPVHSSAITFSSL